MKDTKLYTSIFIMGVAVIILIAIPILLFVGYFGSQEISKEIGLWGSFGDFFGGILNPIISLASLILLGVLTVAVANQSSEAEESLNLKLKRMEAYDLLARGIPSLESFVFGSARSFEFISSYFGATEDHVDIRDKFRHESSKVSDLSYAVTDFYILIKKFNIRYGHIFKYDFQTEKFNHLISLLGEVENTTASVDVGFKSLGYSLENDSSIFAKMHIDLSSLREQFEMLPEPLAELINSLREELS